MKRSLKKIAGFGGGCRRISRGGVDDCPSVKWVESATPTDILFAFFTRGFFSHYIVTACSAFGFTAFEAKTESMCQQTKGGGKVSFTINAAGQVYKQSRLGTWAGLSPPTENFALK